VLRRNGLRAFDVEELATHGGSLRVFICHDGSQQQATPAVARILAEEKAAGLASLEGYKGFAKNAINIKCDAIAFLVDACRQGKKVAGYGAAAKGNTFLNYCGIGPELLSVVADRSPHKQNTLLPGSRIPVVSPEALLAGKPDYVLILPWNLKDEIASELAELRSWGGKFVTAIPELKVF
jgi:hypothetical protein